MSNADVKTIESVELHFRSKEVSAGQLSNDAQTFLRGIKHKKIHQHVHIVVPLPIESMKNNPVLEVARFKNELLIKIVDSIDESGRIRYGKLHEVPTEVLDIVDDFLGKSGIREKFYNSLQLKGHLPLDKK